MEEYWKSIAGSNLELCDRSNVGPAIFFSSIFGETNFQPCSQISSHKCRRTFAVSPIETLQTTFRFGVFVSRDITIFHSEHSFDSRLFQPNFYKHRFNSSSQELKRQIISDRQESTFETFVETTIQSVFNGRNGLRQD